VDAEERVAQLLVPIAGKSHTAREHNIYDLEVSVYVIDKKPRFDRTRVVTKVLSLHLPLLFQEVQRSSLSK
jgi:hypothetical protein